MALVALSESSKIKKCLMYHYLASEQQEKIYIHSIQSLGSGNDGWDMPQESGSGMENMDSGIDSGY